jgi:hypothetical protein
VASAVLATLLVLGLPSVARAATISLGWLTLDQLLPPDPFDPTSIGTNGFNIWNSTGIDFPGSPANEVSFLEASLELMPAGGGDPLNVALGTIHPGFLLDDLGFPPSGLQFPDTLTFSSAVFRGKLSTTSFLLTDGSTFDALTTDLLFRLEAPGGLVPNGPSSAEFTGVEFLLSNDGPTPAPVPEPSTLALLGSGAVVAVRSMRKRKAPVPPLT